MASDKQVAFWDRLRLQHPHLASEFPSSLSGYGRNQASQHITRFLETAKERYGFNPGSRRAQIADALAANRGYVASAYDALVPRLTDDRFDFAFTRNPTRIEKRMGITTRQPLFLSEQRTALLKTIETVAAGRNWDSMGGSSGSSQGSSGLSESRSEMSEQDRSGEEMSGERRHNRDCENRDCGLGCHRGDDPTCPVCHPEQEEQEEEQEEQREERRDEFSGEMTAAQYLARVREIRETLQREASSDPKMALDEIGMRPLEYGALMNRAGIPFEAALYALTMHWAPESRERFGIQEFDPTSFGDREEGKHSALAYCVALAKAGVPIMLVGPKGTGKSHLAQDIADTLGLSYGQCPMTAGATPSWLAGKFAMGSEDVPDIPEPTGDTMDDFLALLQVIAQRTGASSYVSTELMHAVENGGVFVFEEMDSADPNMLLLVNNLLANGAFHNPVNGRTIKKHQDFVPIACTNTFGLGADRRYKGREGLDAATLDRWNMGRVLLHVDPDLEEEIFYNILNAEVTC